MASQLALAATPSLAPLAGRSSKPLTRVAGLLRGCVLDRYLCRLCQLRRTFSESGYYSGNAVISRYRVRPELLDDTGRLPLVVRPRDLRRSESVGVRVVGGAARRAATSSRRAAGHMRGDGGGMGVSFSPSNDH